MRRIEARKRVAAILKSLAEGKGDAYEQYRKLYGFWCGRNSAVSELRPLFRIPGIEPDGRISVTDEFQKSVRKHATEILPLFADAE